MLLCVNDHHEDGYYYYYYYLPKLVGAVIIHMLTNKCTITVVVNVCIYTYVCMYVYVYTHTCMFTYLLQENV